jgi:hypothetical protein
LSAFTTRRWIRILMEFWRRSSSSLRFNGWKSYLFDHDSVFLIAFGRMATKIEPQVGEMFLST